MPPTSRILGNLIRDVTWLSQACMAAPQSPSLSQQDTWLACWREQFSCCCLCTSFPPASLALGLLCLPGLTSFFTACVRGFPQCEAT